jgi:hypothetical protein
MAPMRTGGMAMMTHPKAATYDSIWALPAVLLDSTLWKYTCKNIYRSMGTHKPAHITELDVKKLFTKFSFVVDDQLPLLRNPRTELYPENFNPFHILKIHVP